MKALYRRYRPKTLDDVVGQDQVILPLKKALKDNKIGHAYIFIGPRGTGKTSVARILAHEINQFDYELEDDYLDIIEIDAASNTGVENIRELREKAIIAPTKGKYKVYIIDEVHMLSKSAFNALLKTLEEPPEHVIFIMATTDAYKIPVTITSRSQVLTFHLADPGTMLEHLKKIAKAEKINIDDEALKIVVRRGGGSYRDSLSLLDQVSTISDEKITADELNRIMGLPQDEALQKILHAYAAGDVATIRQTLLDLDSTNIKPSVIAENLISLILEHPENVFLGLLDKLTEVARADYPNVKLLLALTAPSAIANANFAMPSAPVVTAAPKTIATPAPAPTPAPTPKPEAKPAPAKVFETPKPEIEPAPAPEPEQSAPEPEPSIPTSTAEPTPTPEPITADNFNLSNLRAQLITKFEQEAPGAKRYIENSEFDLSGNTLVVYAGKAFNKNQLAKKISMIGELLPDGYDVEIRAEAKQSDETLANIAELMGGGEEVTIDE